MNLKPRVTFIEIVFFIVSLVFLLIVLPLVGISDSVGLSVLPIVLLGLIAFLLWKITVFLQAILQELQEINDRDDGI
jgi:hypothetical protein